MKCECIQLAYMCTIISLCSRGGSLSNSTTSGSVRLIYAYVAHESRLHAKPIRLMAFVFVLFTTISYVFLYSEKVVAGLLLFRIVEYPCLIKLEQLSGICCNSSNVYNSMCPFGSNFIPFLSVQCPI